MVLITQDTLTNFTIVTEVDNFRSKKNIDRHSTEVIRRFAFLLVKHVVVVVFDWADANLTTA